MTTTKQRMIEILAEEALVPKQDIIEGIIVLSSEALTAMQRAVDEETATLRAEVDRLKGCEAIVRELAESKVEGEWLYFRLTARQWVKDNTTKN